MRQNEGYLQDKLLVDVAFGHGGLEVRALQETQKKLVHQLTDTQTRSDHTPFSVCGIDILEIICCKKKIDTAVCTLTMSLHHRNELQDGTRMEK